MWHRVPNELLAEILSFLESPADLASTALVSRRMNSVSESMLYSIVECSKPGGDTVANVKLLLQVLRYPHRAGLVREMKIMDSPSLPLFPAGGFETSCSIRAPERGARKMSFAGFLLTCRSLSCRLSPLGGSYGFING
jgi:hypothetical protein